MQDCVSAWQDFLHEFLKLFQIDIVNLDRADMQFIHETPMQVGEAKI